MPIKVGDKMPSGTLTLATADGPQKVSADDYFKGRKVVLFSVPGAFTPTCDAKHLPGFVEKAADIKKKGVATIACLSVNDAFVMKAWGKARTPTARSTCWPTATASTPRRSASSSTRPASAWASAVSASRW